MMEGPRLRSHAQRSKVAPSGAAPPKGKSGFSKKYGLICALVSGVLGSISGVTSKVGFDFSPREAVYNIDSARYWEAKAHSHRISESVLARIGFTQKADNSGLTELGAKFDSFGLPLGTVHLHEALCHPKQPGPLCVADKFTTLFFIAASILVGILGIQYYVKALSILPSAVEATAANFATNFLVSGMSGAVFFGEWDGLGALSIAAWIGGATLIIGGVVIIGRAENNKVAAKED